MTRYSIYKNLILENPKSKKLNFEPDGREHYIYRVTDYTRDKERHYYGSHTPPKNKVYSNLIDEFWTYKTSSKKNILNENKKVNYKVKIIKVFNNHGDKICYESFLHQYFNVKINKSFWNKSNQTPFGFDTTGLSHNRKITKEGVDKMIETKMKPFVKDGLLTTSAIENAKNASKTMNKVGSDGLTIYQKSTIKEMKTKTKKIIKNGIETTLLKEQGKLSSKTKQSKIWKDKEGKIMRKRLSVSKKILAKKYNIIKNGSILIKNVLRTDIDRVSASLRLKSKNDYLGKSYQSKNVLKNIKYEGLYVEVIKEDSYFEGDIIKELNSLL